MIDAHDAKQCRCKRLGHTVTFHYCRTQEGNSVCPHILNCWWERFDVAAFLEEHLSPEDYAKVAAPPPPRRKLESIMDLIEAAKKTLS